MPEVACASLKGTKHLRLLEQLHLVTASLEKLVTLGLAGCFRTSLHFQALNSIKCIDSSGAGLRSVPTGFFIKISANTTIVCQFAATDARGLPCFFLWLCPLFAQLIDKQLKAGLSALSLSVCQDCFRLLSNLVLILLQPLGLYVDCNLRMYFWGF